MASHLRAIAIWFRSKSIKRILTGNSSTALVEQLSEGLDFDRESPCFLGRLSGNAMCTHYLLHGQRREFAPCVSFELEGHDKHMGIGGQCLLKRQSLSPSSDHCT